MNFKISTKLGLVQYPITIGMSFLSSFYFFHKQLKLLNTLVISVPSPIYFSQSQIIWIPVQEEYSQVHVYFLEV